MYGQLQHVLLRHPSAAFRSQAHLENTWMHFGYESVPDFQTACRDFDAFVDCLERAGACVHLLEDEADSGLDSLYVHDPAITIASGMVVGHMGKPARNQETEAFMNLCQTMHWPVLGRIETPGLLEGGDIVWVDENTLAVGVGFRTNEAGIQQLEAFANDIVENIIRVPLPYFRGPRDVLHLMSLISPIGPSLAVIYRKLLPVAFLEYLIEREYTFIDVPDEEYDSLGCNVLAVSPKISIMAEGSPVTRARIEAKGIEVLTYAPEEISLKGSGGPTCLTRPLVRD